MQKKARPLLWNLTLIVHCKNKPLDYPRRLTGLSNHVITTFLPMSSLRWPVRWLGIYGQKAYRIYGC